MQAARIALCHAAFVLSGLVLVALAAPRFALGQLPAMQVKEDSALKPPPGAQVAIIEFDDLQCPTCAYYNPTLKQAAANYHIPWIRHDFIIPYHPWSRGAAVKARWFDTQNKALGDEYRNEVFANQPDIFNLGALSRFTQQFAAAHGIKLPPDMDPQNKFDAAVTADTDLGKRTGVDATPTIFVVATTSKGVTYKQVLDPDHALNRMIDDALATTAPVQAHANK
jgi:protein-disulfide isomerase